MTTENRSIEPLPSRELIQQWDDEWWDQRERPGSPIGELPFVATKAAQWGFDQRSAVNEAELQRARDEELEACCEVLENDLCCFVADDLRAARRPKPKSQAEEALKAIGVPTKIGEARVIEHNAHELIRAALERLRELEDGNA